MTTFALVEIARVDILASSDSRASRCDTADTNNAISRAEKGDRYLTRGGGVISPSVYERTRDIKDGGMTRIFTAWSRNAPREGVQFIAISLARGFTRLHDGRQTADSPSVLLPDYVN